MHSTGGEKSPEVPSGSTRFAGIVDACAERWSLVVGLPYEGGNVSLVIAVERDDVPTVLKINFPDDESEHEPDALTHWGGSGAVRLLEYDAQHRALLVERCEPGTRLWEIEDDEEATRIAASRACRPLALPHPVITSTGRLRPLPRAGPTSFRVTGKRSGVPSSVRSSTRPSRPASS